MNVPTMVAVLMIASFLLHGLSCTPAPNPDELDRLGTLDMAIAGQKFKLWIADSHSEQANGLMFVTAERMAPLADGTERGMIFVFPRDQHLSFWMKNTIIPLDIAYLSSDGTVIKTYTMAALDDRYNQYPSGRPGRYAIEVNAGVWSRLGLKAGDRIDLPESFLKQVP